MQVREAEPTGAAAAGLHLARAGAPERPALLRIPANRGVAVREGAECLLDVLGRFATRRGRVLPHARRAGDVAIWDDRRTLRRADHRGPGGSAQAAPGHDAGRGADPRRLTGA